MSSGRSWTCRFSVFLCVGILFAFPATNEMALATGTGSAGKSGKNGSTKSAKDLGGPCIPGISKESWKCLQGRKVPVRPKSRSNPAPTGTRGTPPLIRVKPAAHRARPGQKKPADSSKRKRPLWKGSADAPALG